MQAGTEAVLDIRVFVLKPSGVSFTDVLFLCSYFGYMAGIVVRVYKVTYGCRVWLWLVIKL